MHGNEIHNVTFVGNAAIFTPSSVIIGTNTIPLDAHRIGIAGTTFTTGASTITSSVLVVGSRIRGLPAQIATTDAGTNWRVDPFRTGRDRGRNCRNADGDAGGARRGMVRLVLGGWGEELFTILPEVG